VNLVGLHREKEIGITLPHLSRLAVLQACHWLSCAWNARRISGSRDADAGTIAVTSGANEMKSYLGVLTIADTSLHRALAVVVFVRCTQTEKPQD
jgi:hypothetical protein